MRVRFVPDTDQFFDREMASIPREGETVRLYDHHGQVSPRLVWVECVIWDIPNTEAEDDSSVGATETLEPNVQIHLTSKRPRGR